MINTLTRLFTNGSQTSNLDLALHLLSDINLPNALSSKIE